MTYNTWTHASGRYTVEIDHNYDLHAYAVYDADDNLLGTIYPDTIEDGHACRAALDAGEDPVSDGWEDGTGNCCSNWIA